jgi:ATP-binding cassette, subfamily C, bacterial exporter for protease/lipase
MNLKSSSLKRLNEPAPRSLSGIVRTLRTEFAVVGVFSMVVNLLMLVPTLYMLQVYDRVLVSQNQVTLLAVSLVVLFLFGIMMLGEALRSRMLVRTGVRLDQKLGPRVFEASFLAHLDPSQTSPNKPFSDLISLRQFLTGNGIFALFDLPWVIVYVGVLFLLHPWLGILALIFALVQGAIAWWGHRITQKQQEQAQKSQSHAQGFLQGKLRNIEVLSSMGMTHGLQQRWLTKHMKGLLDGAHAQDRGGKVAALSKFVRYSQQSLNLGMGALLVIDGQLSAGAMIAANVLMTRALAPIDQVTAMWASIITNRQAYERLKSLLSLSQPGKDQAAPEIKGSLKVQELGVLVPGRDKPVLKDVTFQATPGTITVVLGHSGSGKSTLARALLGVWTNVQGQVLIDDQPITQFSRATLGPQLGYLPQDIELFDGSIAENISRMGSADSERVIAAAKQAGLHEMILSLPQGYDTRIGASGSVLSGGQRQRVALARALYGQPALLVLDEPNANLDEDGERALFSAMASMRQAGKTVIMISHRPNAIQMADRLVVLQDGQMVASGPRDGVLAALNKQRAAQAQQAAAQATAQAAAQANTPTNPSDIPQDALAAT